MTGRNPRTRPPVARLALPDGRTVLARLEDGLPTFGFAGAPAGLATRRQLRAAGLSPGGQEPAAQIKWRKRGLGVQWAGLYLIDRAAPKRAATARQMAALRRATAGRLAAQAARRRCPGCGADPGYARPGWIPCPTCVPTQERGAA